MVTDAKEMYNHNGCYLCLCDIFYMLDEYSGFAMYESAGIGENVGFSKSMYEQCYDEDSPEFDITATYIGEKNGVRVFRMDYTIEPDWGFDQY